MKSLNTPTSVSTAQLVLKHLWLNVFIFFMLATFAISDDALAFRRNSAGNLEHRIAVLSEQLQLTDDQVEQIRPILEHQMQKRKEIYEAYSRQSNADRRALRAEMRMLREDTNSQIEELLTEEQIAKYEAWQKERHQKMRSRGGRAEIKADNLKQTY